MIFMTGFFQMLEIDHGGVFFRQRAYRVVFSLFFLPKLMDEIRSRFGFSDVFAVQKRLSRAVYQLHEMFTVRYLVQHKLFPANKSNTCVSFFYAFLFSFATCARMSVYIFIRLTVESSMV